MDSKQRMMELHTRRISRVGDSFLKDIRNASVITGEMALKIMNLYGLASKDVMLLCEVTGKLLDFDEFYNLCEEQRNKKTIQAIATKD